ncbi:NUDIX domain-containing protein [Pseudonocardia hispaniensis]|uniref:NUDIX domain-containing protein n=1 Tax=Pseudonocardia hispaniensis TaxID=904933 RepID=A0ABW1J403_9PSEU
MSAAASGSSPANPSGDGWAFCAQGHKHWGVYGASGLLVRHRDHAGHEWVLLQHRALWSHHGGTWGVPGGARHLAETAEQAARREAAEEAHVDLGALRTTDEFVDDHGGWSYTTVVVRATVALPVAIRGGESVELRWVRTDRILGLDLHPGFAATWPKVCRLG